LISVILGIIIGKNNYKNGIEGGENIKRV